MLLPTIQGFVFLTLMDVLFYHCKLTSGTDGSFALGKAQLHSKLNFFLVVLDVVKKTS